MSRKYRIGDQRHAHFVTLTVLHWIDFFSRDEYRQVIVKSIQYCHIIKDLKYMAIASCLVMSTSLSVQPGQKPYVKGAPINIGASESSLQTGIK